MEMMYMSFFFFSSRRRHTSLQGDWSSDVCSSDLADHDSLPDAPLITMIPVSVRDPASKTAMGNKVSAMLAVLPTHLADPGERVQLAHAATKIAKAQQAVIPQGLVDHVSD